jgi:hypothetical protein
MPKLCWSSGIACGIRAAQAVRPVARDTPSNVSASPLNAYSLAIENVQVHGRS